MRVHAEFGVVIFVFSMKRVNIFAHLQLSDGIKQDYGVSSKYCSLASFTLQLYEDSISLRSE